MWHKVSVVAYRIPYIKTWKSSWYSNNNTYADYFRDDVKIRNILKKQLSWIPVWDILLSRNDNIITIDVYTSKSVLVLWKTWENKDRIEDLITRKIWSKVVLNVKEIKKPELNAKIIAYSIANQIEKRMPYKRAIKQALSKAIDKWAKWIKIKVSWRLNWAEIARNETFKEWNIPTQSIRADIDYAQARAETVYWTIWLKVWVYKWDIYKKKTM